MTTPNNDSHAEFPACGELRLVRLLPGPIERVWDFFIDPAKRARWFCGGAWEQTPGGKVEFAMRHANLSPNETPPARFAPVQDPGVTFEGRMLRCEPPRLLTFTFGAEDSVVTIELTPQNDQVLLLLTHRSTGEDIQEQSDYAAGWHTHLSLLLALIHGQTPPQFWATHARLHVHYDQFAAR